MGDIEDLLARLRSPPNDQPSPVSASTLAGLFQNSAMQPSSSPHPQAEQTPRDGSASDRTTNLLNLLKFNQPSAHQDRQPTNTTPSAPDAASQLPSSRPQTGNAEPGSRNQDLLLNLLNSKGSSQPSVNQLVLPKVGHVDENKPIQAPQPQSMTPFSFVGPFEQLAASSSARSPQSESVKNARVNGNHSARDSPVPMADGGRTRLEALLGIGRADAADRKPVATETVAQTIDSLAGPAQKGAQEAIAKATDAVQQSSPPKARDDIDLAVRQASRDLQQDLKDPEFKAQIEKDMPPAVAKSFEQTIENAANEAAGDSWESADATESAEKGGSTDDAPVTVYNFPMKPFVSIDVKPADIKVSSFHEDAIMKVTSFRKDFDQVDRTLATASSNYVVYASAKRGGARVVRQDTGENKHPFRGTDNMVFNISLAAPKSSPLSTESEHLLLTGINGSVYWTSIPVQQEQFETADLNKRGFIFPPPSTGDDATSTSQLKTRAKKSSRHPEFFAIGRGKSIHLIFPKVALAPEYYTESTGLVDSDKYLAERCLRISTGKAGKDFTFSEDDTCLVSLDKSGKLKFWDIIGHTSIENAAPTGPRPAKDVQDPIWTLQMPLSSEKASPTSVQFIDKERHMIKGSALRYLLVGLKQNHTIQLWDLGLGKAVQEINLPHENDTDAICSIIYNAKSGIVAIGHPTRNSIFMIHLSPPQYNLDTMSQANYITRLAKGDRTLPRPESTAIMSGLREISFASIGELRSLDMTTPIPSTVEKIDPAEETLFELYAMHSKGVTCLTIKRRDLGWKDNGKTINPVDAKKVGVISVSDLRLHAGVEPAAEDQAPKSVSKSPARPEVLSRPATSRPISTVSTPGKATSITASTPQANAELTTEKKKPKKRAENAEDLKTRETASRPLDPFTSSENPAAERLAETPVEKAAKQPVEKSIIDKSVENLEHEPVEKPATNATLSDAIKKAKPSFPATDSTYKPLESGNISSQIASDFGTPPEAAIRPDFASAISDALANSIGPHFEHLIKRMNDDKRVQEAVTAANQEAILRLVSKTLGENVEQSLNRIVSNSIQKAVAPAAANAATASIDRRLMEVVPPHLNSILPREIKSSLQGAIANALQSKDLLKAVSDQVGQRLSVAVEADVKGHIQTTVVPLLKDMIVGSSASLAGEVQRRVQEQLRPLEEQHHRDTAVIQELSSNTQRLLQTVQQLASSHGALCQEIAELRAQVSAQQQGVSSSQSQPPALPHEQRDEELDAIAHLMSEGQREEAMIKWLQSSRQSELFDKYFVRFSPDFLPTLNMIVLLSVTMAVAASLKTNTNQRLQWISVILDTIDVQNPDVGQYAPRLLEVLNDKLQDAYMDIAAETQPGSPTLQRIRQLIFRARELKAAI